MSNYAEMTEFNNYNAVMTEFKSKVAEAMHDNGFPSLDDEVYGVIEGLWQIHSPHIFTGGIINHQEETVNHGFPIEVKKCFRDSWDDCGFEMYIDSDEILTREEWTTWCIGRKNALWRMREQELEADDEADQDDPEDHDEEANCEYCATIRANPDGEYDPPAVNGMCYLCYEEECVTCEGCFEGIHKENDKWVIAENYCYSGDGTKSLGTYDYCYKCFSERQADGTFESTDGDLWEFTEEGNWN